MGEVPLYPKSVRPGVSPHARPPYHPLTAERGTPVLIQLCVCVREKMGDRVRECGERESE